MSKKTFYICGIDWQEDLSQDNAGYIKIYGSIGALKDDSPCWEECGIVEVVATDTRWVEEQKLDLVLEQIKKLESE